MRLFALLSLLFLSCAQSKETEVNLSGGIWFNYSYLEESKESLVGDEALVVYIKGSGKAEIPWSYGAELRVGPGGFTDKDNNSTGGNYTLHEAWVAFDFKDKGKVFFGKTQVPFSWKTKNFWPGDMFQAAYGDQMDVGIKYENSFKPLDITLAYYHADDWGSTSTDSTDDNRHWGSSTTYRKVDTKVVDLKYNMTSSHQVGFSYQNGNLQELISSDHAIDGDQHAWAIYYAAKINHYSLKAQYINGTRNLPTAYINTLDIAETIENQRAGIEIGYEKNKWLFLLDATWAFPDTKGNQAKDVFAIAPGARYNYGPGWVYLEYLWQDGWIDRNMMIHEGDFSAVYLTVDFYF